MNGKTTATAKKVSYRVTTAAEVAEFFGVTTAAVSKWASEAVPMPGRKGAYNLSTIAKWRQRRSKESPENDKLKAVDIRLKTANAESKELENQIQRGELVDIDEVDRWAASVLVELRETLMALPEQLATSAPPEIREFVRSESDRHVRDSILAAQRKIEAHDYASTPETEEE